MCNKDNVSYHKTENIPWRVYVPWNALLWRNHASFAERPISIQQTQTADILTVLATMYQNKQPGFLLVAYKQNAAGGVAGKVVQMTGNIQLSVTIKCNFEVLHYTFKDFYI